MEYICESIKWSIYASLLTESKYARLLTESKYARANPIGSTEEKSQCTAVKTATHQLPHDYFMLV